MSARCLLQPRIFYELIRVDQRPTTIRQNWAQAGGQFASYLTIFLTGDEFDLVDEDPGKLPDLSPALNRNDVQPGARGIVNDGILYGHSPSCPVRLG